MEKVISVNQYIRDLCLKYPELVTILFDFGFTEITKTGMLATVGRFVTLKQGAALRKINFGLLKKTLIANGFSIMEEEL